ncbi:copper resistance protein CopC [Candidatus Acetothermia bacterium]|nr:copper resistance protein CopC [Candidatus Acetothermia bacterium]MBI3644274.1 copper resistance protein CopC [Candidatus Acetothermia bacterium]
MKKFAIFSAVSMAALAVYMLVSIAFAHSALETSNIADGQVFSLATVPGEVHLNFTEEIDPHRSAVYVVKVHGSQLVDKGDTVIDGSSMKISMNALDEGVYQITWISVTPDDAGFKSGTITFSVHF